MRKILCAILLVCAVVSCAWADVAINEENFPDENFRAFMYAVDKNSEGEEGYGILSDAELAAITRMGVYEENIESLKGIEYFTNLVYLDCANNPISELNLNANTALTYLDCSYNNLTSLDISAHTALKLLDCRNNRLSVLNISTNTALEELYCQGNSITALNTSTNEALKVLVCRENPITELDLTANTALISFDCQSTDIVTIDVSKNTALETLYAKNTGLTAIDLTNNLALRRINFEYCQLTDIDLSKNTALQHIALTHNQLAELDLSNNISVEELYCGDNDIEELDLRNHTALRYVSCEGNQLSKLDVSGCSELQILFCWGNLITELDLSGNPKLFMLRCESNQLTTLNLSQNISLDTAYEQYLQDNQLYLSIGLQRIPSIDITFQEGSYEYPYALDLKKYMTASDITKVITSSIRAVDEDNEEIGTSYSANGVIEFETSPARVAYRYMTGFNDLSMDVKIGDVNYLTVALNGHIYRLFTKRYTWPDAKGYCESVGGHLITITSDDEFILASELIAKAVKEGDVIYQGEATAWTGGVLSGDSWQWVTDEDFTLQIHWLGEKAAYLEQAVIISGDTIYDVNFDGLSRRYLTNFICEWEPTDIETAPVNPEYEEWRENPQKYFEGYEQYGVIPSPLDLSHITNVGARDVTASIPASFDPRGSEFFPDVEEQAPYGTCWSFASTGALEINYVKQFGKVAPNVSPLHQAWFVYKDPRSAYRVELSESQLANLKPGDNPVFDLGGNNLRAIFFLSSMGVAYENDMPYPTGLNVNTDSWTPTTKYKYPENYPHPLMLREGYFLGGITAAKRKEVKSLILEHGSVAAAFLMGGSEGVTFKVVEGYGNSSYSYYMPNTNDKANHMIQLVGWDDDYPTSNFATKPNSKGAWLVKNSHGTRVSKDGYLWISYEQPMLVSAVYITAENSSGKVYGRGATASIYYLPSYSWSANMFHSTGKDVIREVAFYTFDYDVPYEIYISKHGTTKPANPGSPGTKPVASGKMEYAGYHTVPLDNAVSVSAGEYFSVILKLEKGSGEDKALTLIELSETNGASEMQTAGRSYFCKTTPSSNSWKEMADDDGYYGASIRAFTTTIGTAVITTTKPSITTNSLADGTVGRQYSQTLRATGTTPITWSAEGLPAGLSVEGSAITGKPSTAGTFNVNIIAQNSSGSDEKTLQLVIKSNGSTTVVKPLITTSRLASGTVGSQYSQALSAVSVTTVTWSAEGLPNGLSVNGSSITGTPQTAGTFRVAITAKNSIGSNSKTLQLVIASSGSGDIGSSGGGGGCSSSATILTAAIILKFALTKKK